MSRKKILNISDMTFVSVIPTLVHQDLDGILEAQFRMPIVVPHEMTEGQLR